MSQLKQKKFTKIKNFHCSYFSKHQILQLDLRTNFIGANSRLGIGLSRCENLINLNLNFSKCQLKDVGTQKLCDGLVKCNKLAFLQIDFTKNKIKNEGASILGTCLENIVNLEYLQLNLKKNYIGNKGIQNLGQGIGQSQKLKRLKLILDENSIDKGAKDLALSIQQLGNNLEVLDLSFYRNQMKSDYEIETGAALLNLPNLQILVLSFVYKSEYVKESIFDYQTQQNQIPLQNQHNLLDLSLYFSYINKQNEERFKFLISSLAQKTKLQNLELISQSFNTYENLSEDISHVLTNCMDISTLALRLNDCKFIDKDAQVLGSALEKNTNIQKLNLFLYYNRLGDQGTLQLCNSITNIINLQNLALDLSSNQISDQGTQNLGIALANCINLKDLQLFLNNNKIGNQVANYLFSPLAKCTNISNLSVYLYGNEIGDQGISLLSFNKCLLALSLDFGYNKISKSVLDLGHQLSNCINLQSLNLKLNWIQIDDQTAINLCSQLAKCTNLSSISFNIKKVDNYKFQVASNLKMRNKILKTKKLVQNILDIY